MNYKLPYQNNLIPFHGDLFANDTSVIYLQNETKLKHVAHNMVKLFEFFFYNVCVVPIELAYTASTSHAPTTVTIVDPIKYIVPI